MAILLSIHFLRATSSLSQGFKPETLGLILFGAIALAAIVFFWYRTLKVRVEQKTGELERQAAKIRELNEQLRISNEELQTSNEEYESANEELQLLNDDLNERNARLAEATEQMRALKNFNEKVIETVPSVLVVVDRQLKIVSVNSKYYATFPNITEKAEGAFLADALPPSILYEYDMIRRIRDVADSSSSIRLPAVSYVDEHEIQHFLDIYICPLETAQRDKKETGNVLLVIDDVTEMKRLENEIGARARYLRDLVNNSIVAIMATDCDAKFTLFNEGAERLLKVSSHEMHGTPASLIFFRETDFREILGRLSSEGKVEDYQTEFVGPDRERMDVSLFATNLRNKEGELTGYLIIGTDIRERKRAERNLIRTNKELATLYAIGNTLSSSSPIDRRLRQAAEQTASAFGSQICVVALCHPEEAFRVERVHVAGARHLPTKESANKIAEIMTSRLLSRQEPLHVRSLLEDPDLSEIVTEGRDNGSLMSVPLSVATKMSGSITLIKLDHPPLETEELNLLSSIGQQVAMAIENEKLYDREKENVSRLRGLLGATRVIGSILDPDGVLDVLAAQVMRIIRCRCAAVFSHLSEERSVSVVASRCVGKARPLRKGVSFLAEDSPIEKVLKTSEPCSSHAEDEKKCPIKTALVDAGIVSCFCLPVVFDLAPGILTIGQDNHRSITDAETHILSDLLAHVSLSIKNARLYTALQAAFADLKKAQDTMVKTEKYRAIGELSAGVAHDFNNALSIILGRAQHLMTLTDDKQLIKGLTSIQNASRDAAGTVRRMQEFSKAVTQRPYSRVDVNKMIRQVLDIVEPRLRKLAEVENVQLKVVYKLQRVQPISGDAGELREALTNIIFNAIEAMPGGGRLILKTGVSGDSVFIEVRDTGVGMGPEAQKKAFQPFFTTKRDGTGLGLSVVYGTVQRHSGQIKVNSQPNKGTTVTLLFPVDLAATEVHEALEPTPTRKARILIVDDNPEVTLVLREILESASHEVSTVNDGQEGIKRWQESKFDILVTDIGMPGLSGWAVSKAIKAQDRRAKIILITGWGVQLDQKQVAESGASLAIPKPIEKTRILSAIESVLSGASPYPSGAIASD